MLSSLKVHDANLECVKFSGWSVNVTVEGSELYSCGASGMYVCMHVCIAVSFRTLAPLDSVRVCVSECTCVYVCNCVRECL